MSNESGRPEVLRPPVPHGGGRWQISTAGGGGPRWSRDGRELFYLAAGGSLMRRTRDGRRLVREGTPRELFRVGVRRTNIPSSMSSPDGRTFVPNAVVTEKASTPLTLVQN